MRSSGCFEMSPDFRAMAMGQYAKSVSRRAVEWRSVSFLVARRFCIVNVRVDICCQLEALHDSNILPNSMFELKLVIPFVVYP